MREKDFVEQNKEIWGRFEQLISKTSDGHPDEMSELYNQITNDLSYARTYYDKRSIRVYLNQLAKTVYLQLYKHRRGRLKNFRRFWTDDLPLALYRARKDLNISLIFFLVSMAIGVLSSIHDPEFAKVILGERYVNMTEENIAKGEPMAVYASDGEVNMFFRITFNNIIVAFRTYILGAFFGVGTLVIMLYNGIMVGTFQYFFVERALFQESFLTIWMHGALEISAIVIAGGAGLTLGRGILFPGTLPRLQSFQIGARRSVKIILGLIPIFITAGFIEAFFTRLTEMPDILRGSFIVMCFAFIGLYFWWYPRYKFRNRIVPPYDPHQLIPHLDQPIEINVLRKTREIFTSAFLIFRKQFMKILLFSIGGAVLCTLLFWLVGRESAAENIKFNTFPLNAFAQFHSFDTFPFMIGIQLVYITSIAFIFYRFVRRELADQLGSRLKLTPKLYAKIMLIVAVFETLMLSGYGLVATVALIAVPFLGFWMAVTAVEGTSLNAAFSRMIYLLGGTRRHIFVSYTLLTLIVLMVILLINSPFIWLYAEVLQWNIDGDAAFKKHLMELSLLFINQLALGVVLPLLLAGQLLEYFSAVEAKEAGDLRTRVEKIGVKRSAYGMERE